ncbi:MAG: LCP family protein [Microbacteriaceae bacterium]
MPRPEVPYRPAAAPGRKAAPSPRMSRQQHPPQPPAHNPAHSSIHSSSLQSSPIRDPDVQNPREMTIRGWVLVVANIVFPGLAQLLAGNRKLARIGLIASSVLFAVLVLFASMYFLSKETVMGMLAALATNSLVLLALQLIMVAYILLWIVLTVDTLRLARIVKTGPKAKFFIAFTTIGALVLIGSGVGYAAQLAGIQRTVLDEIFGGTTIAEPIDGRYNILLLGGDAGEDRWGLRPDSISVVSVDAVTGEASMIGIPRNLENAVFSADSPLWAEFPNGYDCGHECLISFLYTHGITNPDLYPDAEKNSSDAGIEAMRDAVEGVTGLTLQYYVLIDMAGFVHLIDALGGVTVDVQTRVPLATAMDANGNFTDLHGWIEPGVQLMSGDTALWYARSRVSTTDYDRMQRQRQVQEAILAQFDPVTVIGRYQQIAQASTVTVKTDIPASMLTHFADLALKSQAQPIQDLELVPPLVMTGNPNLTEIKQLIADFLAPELEPEVPSKTP